MRTVPVSCWTRPCWRSMVALAFTGRNLATGRFMKIIRHTDSSFSQDLAPLWHRQAFDPAIDQSVAAMLAEVRQHGDAALTRFAQQFDKCHLPPERFLVTAAERQAASATLTARQREAMALAHAGEAEVEVSAVLREVRA